MLGIFVNPLNRVVGFTDEGFGQDIFDTFNAAFASYGLHTSIGPITGPSYLPQAVLGQGTSAGVLVITSAGDSTFTAIVTPLPAALPLFASGLVGLGLLGWRRKRKAEV